VKFANIWEIEREENGQKVELGVISFDDLIYKERNGKPDHLEIRPYKELYDKLMAIRGKGEIALRTAVIDENEEIVNEVVITVRKWSERQGKIVALSPRENVTIKRIPISE